MIQYTSIVMIVDGEVVNVRAHTGHKDLEACHEYVSHLVVHPPPPGEEGEHPTPLPAGTSVLFTPVDLYSDVGETNVAGPIKLTWDGIEWVSGANYFATPSGLPPGRDAAEVWLVFEDSKEDVRLLLSWIGRHYGSAQTAAIVDLNVLRDLRPPRLQPDRAVAWEIMCAFHDGVASLSQADYVRFMAPFYRNDVPYVKGTWNQFLASPWGFCRNRNPKEPGRALFAECLRLGRSR